MIIWETIALLPGTVPSVCSEITCEYGCQDVNGTGTCICQSGYEVDGDECKSKCSLNIPYGSTSFMILLISAILLSSF